MASITSESNGRRTIQFVGTDGKRRSIRLGKMPLRTAEGIQLSVESLIGSMMGKQTMQPKTAAWVAEIDDVLHGRLAAVGLVEPRVKAALNAFIDAYLAQRSDVKPGTMIVFRQAQRHLVRFLGEGKDVAKVTPADADAFRTHLLGEKRAKATVNKWCQYARHFFEVACRRRLISENPFAHIKGAVRGNTARRVFVPADHVQRVIAAAPGSQWKLLIALARWGGLRIPSEAIALTWRDVDFENHRFIVRSSKTERHDDGGVRSVPMFPELVEHFQRVFDEAEDGAVNVITIVRDSATNLRTQLVRYIEAAGLKPWPKPWQNLRSTRATELADKWPSHVCAAWLGHTEAVADEFYRSVTDDHFARAVEAVHNPVQQLPQTQCNAVKTKTGESAESLAIQGTFADCSNLHLEEVGAVGFEPTKA